MVPETIAYHGAPENNDQWIHRIVFQNRNYGTFVELGAADGMGGSSCCSLEKIGWRGICVEPSSYFFPMLCHNRPYAICENACITNLDGFVQFLENKYFSRVDYDSKYSNVSSVPSLTLSTLLKKHRYPKVIDYLAMDIEQSEPHVLGVFPFSEYHIQAISMEGNLGHEILIDNHFVKVINPFNRKSPWESYYIHEDHLVTLQKSASWRFISGNFL